MSLLLAFLLSTANAGFWSDLCAKHLIAEDKWPLSDTPADFLLNSYRRTSNADVLRELVFRLRAGGLTDDQVDEFWKIVKRSHKRQVNK